MKEFISVQRPSEMASAAFWFYTWFLWISSVFSHRDVRGDEGTQSCVQEPAEVEADWGHWQGRWPVVGRGWGLKYGPGLEKKMFQFCLSLILHCPRQVSPPSWTARGRMSEHRQEALGQLQGTPPTWPGVTWAHSSERRCSAQTLESPLYTGLVPPLLWASIITQSACLNQWWFTGSLVTSPTNSYNSSPGKKHSWLAFCPSPWTHFTHQGL